VLCISAIRQGFGVDLSNVHHTKYPIHCGAMHLPGNKVFCVLMCRDHCGCLAGTPPGPSIIPGRADPPPGIDSPGLPGPVPGIDPAPGINPGDLGSIESRMSAGDWILPVFTRDDSWRRRLTAMHCLWWCTGIQRVLHA
jgi:hypothetical protein